MPPRAVPEAKATAQGKKSALSAIGESEESHLTANRQDTGAEKSLACDTEKALKDNFKGFNRSTQDDP